MSNKKQSSAHCHKQIAKTAKGLAEASYEELMSDNMLYEIWWKRNPGASAKTLRTLFVARNWGKYIPAARATLTLLLSEPIDEGLKEEIMEALVLDSTLIRGRQNPMTVLGQHPTKN